VVATAITATIEIQNARVVLMKISSLCAVPLPGICSGRASRDLVVGRAG